MTTSNDVTNKLWTGLVAAASTLNLTFDLQDDDDLLITSVVIATGVETSMVKGVNYSVTTGSSPVLTAITQIDATDKWVIDRQHQPIQDVDYETGSKLPAAAFEAGLDKVTNMHADLWTQLKRVIKAPDGEIPVSGDWTMPTLDVRKSNFLFWDSLGNLTPVAGVTSVDPAVITALGTSLIESSTAAAMRTILEVDKWGPYVAQGDLLVMGAASDPTVITSPTAPGLVLATSALNLSELTAEGSSFEPQYAKPWPDPFTDVVGFNCQSDAGTGNTVVGIGQGYCHPKFRSGASGAENDFGTDGKVLRFDTTFSGSWTKAITAAWAAGNTNGALVDGYSHSARDPLYLFVIGRSEDDTVDFAVDDNIEGTGIAATVAIIAWAGTAGSGKLFVRRIRTLMTVATFVLEPFHTVGDETLFENFWSPGTLVFGLSVTNYLGPGPLEPHKVWGTYHWTGGIVDVQFYLMNQWTQSSPGISHTNSIAVKQVSGITVDGMFRLAVGPNNRFYISNGSATLSLAMYFKGFTDPRGRTL